MVINDDLLKKYKKLVVSESFPNVDINTITDDMIKQKMEKGYMECPSNKKFVCFSCGSYLRKIEDACPICDRSFSA